MSLIKFNGVFKEAAVFVSIIKKQRKFSVSSLSSWTEVFHELHEKTSTASPMKEFHHGNLTQGQHMTMRKTIFSLIHVDISFSIDSLRKWLDMIHRYPLETIHRRTRVPIIRIFSILSSRLFTPWSTSIVCLFVFFPYIVVFLISDISIRACSIVTSRVNFPFYVKRINSVHIFRKCAPLAAIAQLFSSV